MANLKYWSGTAWVYMKTIIAQKGDTGDAGAGAIAGSISMYAGASAPAGYFLCDGAAISRTDYATLFAIVGTTYGVGDGSLTFNLPNLKGKIPFGKDSAQTEFDVVGEVGGAKVVTLDVTQIPAHAHTQNAHSHTQDAHNHIQNAHTHTQDAHTHVLNGGSTDDTTSPFPYVDASSASVAVIAVTGINSATATNQNTTPTNQVATATNQNTIATNQNTGGGLSHSNLPPYIVLNYIIKT
jgi:microcystin-dependent protein